MEHCKATLTQINLEERFTSIAAGVSHSLAIDTNGRLWFWGDMDSEYPYLSNQTSPTLIDSAEHFVFIAAGHNYSIALDINGDLWTWGKGNKGQLGHGDYIGKKLTPTKMKRFSDKPIVTFAAGETHSLFIDNGGRIWRCGKYHAESVPTYILTRILEMPQTIKLPRKSSVKSARK